MNEVAFYTASCMAIVSSLLVITRKNPVYSALYLMPFFVSFAVIFLLLSAGFLAAMQVMIYVGAILVMFLFVIMLLNLGRGDFVKEIKFGTKIIFAFLPFVLFGILAIPVVRGEYASVFEKSTAGFGSTGVVGKAIFTNFIVPFEFLSILIIIAIVGVILLAKRGD
jgi:NADH-quinone oxidoreductase subunit J